MKYIMVKTKLGEMEALMPIIFPNALTHSLVADAIQAMPGMSSAEIHSAGFIHLRELHCFGESETLEVASSPQDSAIIIAHDYFHGLNHDNVAQKLKEQLQS